jgi:hypothetical protein
MSIILEQIIRQVLLEQRTVAKIKQISAQEEMLAKSKGAVQAYAVLVKGTNNTLEIQDLVLSATLASVGAETESVESVGVRSKYANDKYVYVMSDPDSTSKKRQRILVYILPNPFKNWKGRPEDNLPWQLIHTGTIGDASLMTLTDYNNNLEVTKSSNQKLNIDVPDEPDEPIKNKDAEDDDNIVKPEVKVFTYPYKFTNKDGKEFTIYTLNDTDPYVYTFTDNSYWKTDKKEFEASKPNPTSTQVTDEATINKLNTLTGNKVTVNKEQPKPEEKKKENPKKPEEKKKEKPEEKKKERTFTVGETVTVKPKSAFYSWNSATNSFDKLGTTDPKITMSGKYLGKSKSQGGKYIRVKFKEGEFWVNISSIK